MKLNICLSACTTLLLMVGEPRKVRHGCQTRMTVIDGDRRHVNLGCKDTLGWGVGGRFSPQWLIKFKQDPYSIRTKKSDLESVSRCL